MTAGLSPVLLLMLTVSPLELEYRGTQHLVREFDRVRRPTPEGDPALAAAARAIAREALDSGAGVDTLTIAERVSEMGGADPTPRALVLRGSPPSESLRALLDRSDLARNATSHVGLGAAVEGDRSAVAVLLSERKAELESFPRTLSKAGVSQTLCGKLFAPLERAELYVTQPAGQVAKVPATMTGPRFCARLEFTQAGHYTVEVVGHGPAGPEVAALFFVDAGARYERDRHLRVREPTTLPEARRTLVERINALRQANGLTTLQEDELLSKVAQAYSEQMARQGFFAHVGPDGQDIKARLRGAGYMYSLAGENLGVASGPLAAHFGIEHSPGHRKNLLEAEYTKVGIGVAFQRQADREQVLVTEIFAAPNRETLVMLDNLQRLDASARMRALEAPAGSGEAEAMASLYRAVDAQRKAEGAPPLPRGEALELLAREHAQRARELGEAPEGPSEDEQIFANQQGLSHLSVSVAQQRPPGAPPLPVGKESGCTQVGAAAIEGREPGVYWVAVACARSE